MKLDPKTIPYRVIEYGGQMLVALLFIGATSGNSGTILGNILGMLGVGVVIAIVVSGWQTVRYRRFEYAVTDDTFDIRSGVFSRREREIPYGRIQNVDVAQNAIQRVFGIAEVRFETAGGQQTEAQLKYVSRAEADRLQELVSERTRGAISDADPDAATTGAGEELFRLSNRELGILGVVSADFRLLGLVTILASGFAPALVDASAASPGTEFLLTIGPVFAVLALFGLWVLNALRSVLRYYGFRLTRQGDELRYERGLLQQYNGTIPLEKVQSISIRENVLARRLGYATLLIETAGYAASSDTNVESAVPLAERERVLELARSVEPVGELDFERPPRRARTRYAIRYTLGIGLLTAAAYALNLFIDPWIAWYLPLGLLLVVPVAAHLAWANRGYALDENYAVTRNGFWRRETAIVPYDRVQTVISSQTIFQRRRNLGSVTIDTATGGGLAASDATAVDVDAADAEDLRETVAARLQRALAAT